MNRRYCIPTRTPRWYERPSVLLAIAAAMMLIMLALPGPDDAQAERDMAASLADAKAQAASEARAARRAQP